MPNLYLALKLIHILGSAVLFGTGLGIAFFMFLAHRSGDPAAIVSRLVDAVPPGSYLTIAHPASDVATEQMATSMRNYNEHVAVPLTARSHDEVSAFFAGLDLVEPGLVQLHRWRAGTGDPGTGRELANYGGLGRKP